MATICEKIDAFERHVFTRQLRIAQLLAEHFTLDIGGDELSESGFAILSIGLSYFEMIEQFATGQSSDHAVRVFFEGGFARVYPVSTVAPADVSRIYYMVRCGMYHTAMPKDRCGLSRHLPAAVANENGVIVINPDRLIADLIKHFASFCSDLRDGAHYELCANFERMFDSLAANAPTILYGTTEATRAPWAM
jgi:hypothetical protein